ncbi:hypothetical protein [Xylanibacter ruminicola]|jgi:hypothetical protein|uniref:DUF4359 domain-containing protein n=1 Tax=Xylanibacter ruminicola TaxID=839 RepID=A0A1M6V0N3_XYLRU|nr:hypothetical protein [Xylanibacter ruminicola]SHK75013.1 hypothetical protein SAMN05216463_11157 [Xylanibacter ruminicola]
MKKFLIFLGIIAVIAVALMATTPDRQQHADTIKSVISGAVNAELRDNNIDGPLASIASVAATTAVDQYLNTSFLVRDHRFYSLGFIDYNNEFQLVSVGVLNHVYTLNEEQAREMIKKKLSPLDLMKDKLK